MPIAALALLALLVAGCLRPPEPAPPPPPRPPTPSIYLEEDLQPAPTIRLEIIGLDDSLDPRGEWVTVTGVLINRGTKPTSQVSVVVRSLDEHGDTRATIHAVPASDRIAADGGTTTFRAELPHDPAVRSFHVEAVAR